MPNNWLSVTLGEHSTWASGGTPPKDGAEFWNGDIPWISASSMKSGRLSSSDRTLTIKGLERGSRLAQQGSVLLLVRGSELHKRVPVGIATCDVAFNQDVKAINASDPLSNEYLYYWLVANEPQLLSKVEPTGIGAGKLDTSILKGLLISVPSYPKVRDSIVQVAKSLDDKIELNQRMAATLEEMARALFKSWFVDFDPVRAKAEGRPTGLPPDIDALFPDELVESELGLIPQGWKVSAIYEIAEVIYGAPFASSQFNTDGRGVPLVRIRDLAGENPGVWTTEVHPKGYKIRGGDIVVGMDGEFRAHLWGGDEAWLNQRVCVFAPKSEVSHTFLRNSIFKPLAYIEATETATTVIHLGKGDIDRFRVVIPSPQVLALFGRSCQPLYDRIVRCKQECRALAAIRDSLLPDLISGKLEIQGN
jgi:type I restriction enzyme S subunit